MLDRLASLYVKLRRFPVRTATTQAERDAIYRFRYTIYVEELEREIGGVDHERRMVCDDEDERPWSHHLYVGTPEAIDAVIRLRVWGPGEAPDSLAKSLSFERFGPAIQAMTVAEIGRFMISQKKRGAPLLLASLAYESYLLLGRDKAVDLAFSYCRPGLVPYYRRLGARPYGGEPVYAPEGMEVPLVSVMSDREYYKAMGSPMAPLVSDVFGEGRRRPVDDSSFRHLFDNGRSGVVADPEQVFESFAEQLVSDPGARRTFLSGLPEKTVELLAGSGLILDVGPDTLVTREGHAEREVFVVLDGELEVRQGERVVAKLGPGELFGEMAFFLDQGRRTASVKTLRRSRLVVLRRSFLDKLEKKDTPSMKAILLALGRVLAERLQDANRRTSE
jgi:hypothetical protein